MKYAPKKVFVLEDGRYIELSYQEFSARYECADDYPEKFFIPLHGMLMEVNEEVYRDFYKSSRRQKYLDERSKENGDFSYDMLTTDEFNGEDILVDETQDIEAIVADRIMLDKLQQGLSFLSEDEKKFIFEIFDKGLSERELAAEYGISQAAIHKRKDKILKKLKNWIKI